jgi:putative ABC transport system ATP-binding protein
MIIEFRNVSVIKRFSDEKGNQTEVQALSNVSFSVKEGEVFAVMGPSGSGKSTLLRLINRLEDPLSGEILINGKNIKDFPVLKLRRKVGFVFQLPLMFEGNVKDNILYGPLLAGRNPDELDRKLTEYLPWFGFENSMLTREPGKLSVGERQRVCMLRAIMNEPEILLMDEPTASLDPGSTEKILELVKKINANERITILMVTHIPEHAEKIAQRGMVLVEGRKVSEDPIETLVKEIGSWDNFKRNGKTDNNSTENR